MIIDLETQVWSSPGQLGSESTDWRLREDSEGDSALDPTPSAHDNAMRCVDVAAVLGFRSLHTGAHIPSEAVAAFVAKAPRRRIGFAGIDPLAADSIEAIDAALSLGLTGVVVAPALQNFHPTHSRAMRVYERCQELGIPIIVKPSRRYSSQAVMAYARPMLFDEVARAFPNLRLVIGGLGYPWMDEVFVLVGKHRHLYTDLAGIVSRPWQLYNALLSAFEQRVLDKILFASGFPYDAPERAIARIYSLNSYSHGTDLPSIPRQQLRAIVERDAFDCLGIERPEGMSISGGIGGLGEGVEPKPADAAWDEDEELAPQIATLAGLLRHPSETRPGGA